MFERILKYFESREWKYQAQETDEKVAYLGFELNQTNFNCLLIVNEQAQKIIFYTLPMLSVPESLRDGLAKLLVVLNYNLIYGSFDMDINDGELRFRLSAAYDRNGLSDELLDTIFMSSLSTIDIHYPLIKDVANGKIGIDKAIEEFNLMVLKNSKE